MAGPTDLHALALDLLAAAASALDEIDSPLLKAPERRIVAYGPPVDDCCEQLAVQVNPIVEADTGPRGANQTGKRHNRAWLNEVMFTVTMGRCVPKIEVVNGKPVLPTPAAITAGSEQINADGWALWNGLHNRVAADELFGSCANVKFGPLTARTPSGGCGGWTIDIRVIVGGYRPAGS